MTKVNNRFTEMAFSANRQRTLANDAYSHPDRVAAASPVLFDGRKTTRTDLGRLFALE